MHPASVSSCFRYSRTSVRVLSRLPERVSYVSSSRFLPSWTVQPRGAGPGTGAGTRLVGGLGGGAAAGGAGAGAAGGAGAGAGASAFGSTAMGSAAMGSAGCASIAAGARAATVSRGRAKFPRGSPQSSSSPASLLQTMLQSGGLQLIDAERSCSRRNQRFLDILLAARRVAPIVPSRAPIYRRRAKGRGRERRAQALRSMRRAPVSPRSQLI